MLYDEYLSLCKAVQGWKEKDAPKDPVLNAGSKLYLGLQAHSISGSISGVTVILDKYLSPNEIQFVDRSFIERSNKC